MQQGDSGIVLRAIGRSIEQAVIEHEERMHARGPRVVNLPPSRGRPLSIRPPVPPEPAILRSLQKPESVAAEDVPLIQAAAVRILRECSCTRPPVPANVVAMFDPSRPVEILEADLGYERGDIGLSGGAWRIQVNSFSSPRSRRFIVIRVIREAFSILLQTRSLELESNLEPAVEWLADRFASYLLMPEHWVREIWPRLRHNQVVTMAGIFDVSQAAMRIRLRELELLGCTSTG